MILQKEIEDKTIVWLAHSNQYLIVENIVAKILHALDSGSSKKEIKNTLLNYIDIPKEKADRFIIDIEKLLHKHITHQKPHVSYNLPENFISTKYYKINGTLFFIEFLSDYEISLIHPKFAHLEIAPTETFDFHYQVFTQNEHIFFLVNNSLIDAWSVKESHYFQGKFSMKIIESIHKKEETQWMGIFHASAVSNNKEAVLFLGDSGNGKSTSLALLQASGFNCLADDFVPIASQNQEVYSFPSAISIKENSLGTLLPIYPELENAAVYHFKSLHKTVRYLPPKVNNAHQHQKCHKLVFIKYQKKEDFSLQRISKKSAFQRLVPDSWLSPSPKNAQSFLNWFSSLTCYELTYSNNKKMIESVQEIFANEL
ncbi:phosphoenolpyruvate carboxykinase (ATP) [Tenacibaculum maritimum]|uniref:hypothetical protein n=1 Tax=Tenacibaculum maritimum TaxID=107401 RepID=UPI0012E590C7|nr:hypothetical protein [Tenacibaculum maritimum]CAA0144065.1 conserved hypothetical protein [Tenacibaculum maritimum]CAA0144653.1 conserved hypothetical protein [Tenacibaculum maritimum]CAA0144924.1 conserved hypothetical protein [Tenacibaculum maritimum]CAA0152872.1 conserved hypothetical protein [Tenacibaculum maritimum]